MNKKVICVDAKNYAAIDKGSIYEVSYENDCNYFIFIDGCIVPYHKECFEVCDTEPAYSYGQKVEYHGEPAIYIAKSPSAETQIVIIERKRDDGITEVDHCLISDISPIRSVRDRIVEVLKPKLAFNSIEEMDSIIDRILEITNPADK